MIINNKNSLQFFTFSKLNGFGSIRHAIFTRANGNSKDEFKSLNAGLFVGDDKESVERNRRAIAGCMETCDLVFADQVHSTGILIFKKSDQSGPSAAGPLPLSGDAIITDIPGKTLAIQLADCQGILMHDPEQQVVAGVHSGWRGSIANILGACVESMQREFGCRPENIVAGISPSLGPCCAEFVHYQQEIPEEFWRYKDKSHYFNFWALSCDQLISAGLLSRNIEQPAICTKCNSHLFFSYRKKNRTGRFIAVIGLI